MLAASTQPIRVALVCPGLGHIGRGFETFTRECYDALRPHPRLDVRLFKGAGRSAGSERAVWCLQRSDGWAGWLGRRSGRGSYFVEQATFVGALTPRLLRWRPDVVMFSDGAVGNLLWHVRRRIGGQFRLLASNGGPMSPDHLRRFDHVHQVVPSQYDAAAAAGRSPDTQTLVPYGFRVRGPHRPLTPDEQQSLRRRLKLPSGPLVLAVGAVNVSHKRMDYLVREVAALTAPGPTLVILGQQDAEALAVRSLAVTLLPPSRFVCRTVPAAVVSDYYRAADVFALASLDEGFGRVFVEAQLLGLPCVAHDGPVQRYVLGSDGHLADLREAGELTKLLTAVLVEANSPERQVARHRSATERFGWERLTAKYADMVERCARHAAKGDS